MKKIFFLSLVSLVAVANVHAQKFNFGVHATPTFNFISTNHPDAETGVDLMFGFGLLSEYRFTDNYSLATGVDIIRRGGELRLNDTTGKYNSGFVQIPIALKLRTREFGYFTYFAKFGGDIAIETGERTEISPKPLDPQSSYVNPVNFNFQIGGGVEYSLGGSTKIFGELTYHRSLIDNLNDNDPRLSDQYVYRFDYIALSVGVIF